MSEYKGRVQRAELWPELKWKMIRKGEGTVGSKRVMGLPSDCWVPVCWRSSGENPGGQKASGICGAQGWSI